MPSGGLGRNAIPFSEKNWIGCTKQFSDNLKKNIYMYDKEETKEHKLMKFQNLFEYIKIGNLCMIIILWSTVGKILISWY